MRSLRRMTAVIAAAALLSVLMLAMTSCDAGSGTASTSSAAEVTSTEAASGTASTFKPTDPNTVSTPAVVPDNLTSFEPYKPGDQC